MTLKCWTSAIREPQPTDDVTEMQYSASSGSSGTVGSATIPAPSGPSTISIVTTSARPHPTSQSFTEFRRRSVGFIHTTPLVPDDGLQGLAMTPTRNYHKANRYRSLSSNWDKMDSDEDSEVSEHEEKHGENGSTDQRRRDLMFTPMTSIGRHFSNNQTAHHDFHTRRRAHGPKSARNRRRRTMSESSGSASRRVRILSPASSKVFFCGWVRGQSAEVRWEVVDKSVQSVRIDVCNVAWAVPTTIAHRVPNDGYFQWKRVYWGMPITDGYYVNIYDVTDLPPEEQQTESSAPQPNQQENQDKDKTEKIELALLARSECFAVVG
ncbi:hypothetical protein Poli38472_007426 [Pythium oligandrum]|uniref:Uncharacterized protein n=1 Tax=Pythium oligandrum TaxID=41045 RepID=A0A8K1FNW6_PYTOL|nr:hypothetical protein Poli38472_007426 [Pythium oligandrum]|eukprot:TMW67754.1 hypothetical protein Poli38472_007426 [Pythium oligandrum]